MLDFAPDSLANDCPNVVRKRSSCLGTIFGRCNQAPRSPLPESFVNAGCGAGALHPKVSGIEENARENEVKFCTGAALEGEGIEQIRA